MIAFALKSIRPVFLIWNRGDDHSLLLELVLLPSLIDGFTLRTLD